MQESPPIMSIHEGNRMFKPLLERFLMGVVGRLKEVSLAIESSDLQTLQEATHRLKGSAATFGFPQLTVSIAKLEESFSTGVVEFSSRGEPAKCFNSLVNQCARLSSNGKPIKIDQSLLLL